MAWEIKGESGKTMDATSRSLPTLRIQSCSLRLQTLADDVLTWVASTDNATGAGTIIPAAGQVVEVFVDGNRRFLGNVAKPQVGLSSVTVVAYGPWWWMGRIALSGNSVDGSGASGERAAYVFPEQGLKTSIEDLVARMIDRGVPNIALGTVDSMFTCPRITLSNMSFAAALGELLRWCPDAVSWIDYTVHPPQLNVSRRGGMTELEFTVGVDNVEDVSINPRLDLEVAQTRLNYVTRNATNGRPEWASQSDGTSAAGKRQIITVSGPEIAAFLPKDDFESYGIETESSASVFVNEREPSVVAARKQYGSGVNAGAATGESITLWKAWKTTAGGGADSGGVDKSTGVKSVGTPGLSFVTSAGASLKLAGRYLVLTKEVPAWVGDLAGVSVWNGTLSGMLLKYFCVDNKGTFEAETKVTPSWITALGMTSLIRGFTEAAEYEYWGKPFSMAATLVSVNYATPTTLYKPLDYSYLTPPTGLAGNLRSAQNWVPWEGPITLVSDTVSGYNALGRKINLAGSYAAHATMDALVRSVTYDPVRGRRTYDLGAPARSDFGSMVQRVRRDPGDNIIFV